MIKVNELANENGFKPIEIKLTIETKQDLEKFYDAICNVQSKTGQELFDFLNDLLRKIR